MYEAMIPTLLKMFEWPAPLYLLLGALLGYIFGILPGLGGPQVLAVLTPISISMEPTNAIILLIGAMGAIATSGSLTAILINTPGTGESAATTLDGFPLAKQGKAGYAIGASVSASLFGGIFGAVILTAVLPFGKFFVLAFSFQEYFMMAVMGLCLIATLSKGSLWKGLISGSLGLVIACMGYDPITGSTRYTFGNDYLYDGIGLVPAIIGLFAICEGIELVGQRGAIAGEAVNTGDKLTGVWAGIKSPFVYWGTFLRGSIIGTIIGIIPGVGGAVANWLAYGQEVSAQKGAGTFGKGDIRGVIAPESANNAKDGGALVPTLIFGIPGGAQMAVLIGALMLHGIQPGPRLMMDNPQIALALIYSLVLSNVAVAVLSIISANHLAKLTFVSGTFVGPLVLVLGLVGAYINSFEIQDVIVALVFGALGYTMNRFGYSRVALLIALVLGELMQKSLFQSLLVDGWSGFVTRPFSLTLLILTIVLVAYPLLKSNKPKDGGPKHEQFQNG